MKLVKLMCLLTVVILTGCVASGRAEYEASISVKPIVTAESEIVCCDLQAMVKVDNGKNIDIVDFGVEKGGDGSFRVWLKEDGVDASEPAAIAAAQNANIVDTAAEAIGDAAPLLFRAIP